MKICLVYSAINTYLNTGYNYGLGYIAAVLKDAGHEIDYITLRTKGDVSMLCRHVARTKPGIIAFSATSTQFDYVIDVSLRIRRNSKAFMICGGVHATLDPDCIEKAPALDAICRGEGEYPLLELANALQYKKDYLHIKNFWFRKNGRIIKNPIRPLIKDLDKLPFPDRESLNYQKVIDEDDGVVRFIFSRGCPFDCSYCSNRALSQAYPDPHHYFRQMSPKRAIAEIENAEKKYKFRAICFDDDTLSLNKKWFYEFLNMYKEKFNYPFRCNLRIGTVTPDMIRLLKEAGAENVGIGIEHGNEKFRRNILRKDISNKHIINTFKLLDKHGITHGESYMTGLPFETKRMYWDTVRLCRKISDKGYIAIFEPYPGTELHAVCEKNDWLAHRKYYMEREEAVIGYPQFSREDIQLCHDMFPYLIRYKFIPVYTNLRMLDYMIKFVRVLKNILFYIPRKIKLIAR